MSGAFFGELLADALEKVNSFSIDIQSDTDDISQAQQYLKKLIKILLNVNSSDLREIARPLHAIENMLAQFPFDNENVQVMGNQINELRNFMKQFLELRNKAITVISREQFIKHQRSKAQDFSKDFDGLRNQINDYKPPGFTAYIEKEGTQYVPIARYHSHFYEPDLFPPDFEPIDPFYIAQFLNRFKINDTSLNIQQAKSFINQTNKLHDELYKMDSEAKYDFEIDRTLAIEPELSVLQSYPLYAKMIKQNQEYSILLDKHESELALSEQNVAKYAADFYDLVTSVQKYTTESEQINSDFPCLAAQINKIDTDLRLLKSLSDIIATITIHPMDGVITALNEYYEKRNYVQDFLDVPPEHGFGQADLSAMQELQKSFGDLTEKLKQAHLDTKEIIRDTESQLQKMMQFPVQRAPPEEPQLIETRDRVFDLSQQVSKRISEYISATSELSESLLGAINSVAGVAAPEKMSSVIARAVSDDSTHLLWSRSVRDELEESVRRRRGEIDRLQRKIDAAKEAAEAGVRSGEEDIARGTRSKVVGRDLVYDELRLLTSCPRCEWEAEYCVGKCGHLVCPRCAEKARRVKPLRCPVCSVNVSASDFIKIVWN